MVSSSRLHIERTVFEPALGRSQASWRNAVAIEHSTIGGVLVLGVLLLARFAKALAAARSFGASWFLPTYLPVSNLLDLNATVAEHWLYIPSVGFCIFLAGILFDLPPRYLRSTAAFACVAVGLSTRSLIRSSDWADPETFSTNFRRRGIE